MTELPSDTCTANHCERFSLKKALKSLTPRSWKAMDPRIFNRAGMQMRRNTTDWLGTVSCVPQTRAVGSCGRLGSANGLPASSLDFPDCSQGCMELLADVRLRWSIGRFADPFQGVASCSQPVRTTCVLFSLAHARAAMHDYRLCTE